MSKDKAERGSFGSRIKSFDIYGSQAHLNFRGEKTYKTMIGAIVTIASVSFIMIYAGIRFERWANINDNFVVSNTVLRENSGDLVMPAEENRF